MFYSDFEGITPRGHEFKNTHVFSILKKKKVRDERQNERYELEMGKLSMILLDDCSD